METIHERCAGLDVHKDTVVACVRIASARSRHSRPRRAHFLSCMIGWRTVPKNDSGASSRHLASRLTVRLARKQANAEHQRRMLSIKDTLRSTRRPWSLPITSTLSAARPEGRCAGVDGYGRSGPHYGSGALLGRFDGEVLAVFSFPIPPPTLPSSLSEAERDVAVAVLKGLSNTEIAASRGTASRTAANQVASLLRKLGVRSRTEAVAALARLQRS
jgi:DNA-binding CsgD family transcriptional regulator